MEQQVVAGETEWTALSRQVSRLMWDLAPSLPSVTVLPIYVRGKPHNVKIDPRYQKRKQKQTKTPKTKAGGGISNTVYSFI